MGKRLSIVDKMFLGFYLLDEGNCTKILINCLLDSFFSGQSVDDVKLIKVFINLFLVVNWLIDVKR